MEKKIEVIGFVDELFDPQRAFQQVVQQQMLREDRLWELSRPQVEHVIRPARKEAKRSWKLLSLVRL